MKTLWIFTILLLGASCGKDDKDDEPLNLCDAIFSLERPNVAYKAKFSYDALGRMDTVTYGENNTSVYVYSEDKIIEYRKFHSAYTFVETYLLDEQKRIIKIKSSGNDFVYNQEGYLIKTRYFGSYGTNFFESENNEFKYENGNLVECKRTFIGGSTDTSYFQYYDQPNQKTMMVMNSAVYYSRGVENIASYYFLVLQGYFGKSSKNLLKSSGYRGSPIAPLEYNYVRDDKGRIIDFAWGGCAFKYVCP